MTPDLVLTFVFWSLVMGAFVFVIVFRIIMDWRNRR